MNALTLHAMDDRLVVALRRYASELGTSLNQAAKTLIASALGLSSSRERRTPGFMRFAGGFTSEDAAELRSFVDAASFSKINESDWK